MLKFKNDVLRLKIEHSSNKMTTLAMIASSLRILEYTDNDYHVFLLKNLESIL